MRSNRSTMPLNALRAFDAAARHLSFKRAAEELSVTPAAVSHQIKALEEFVGVSLFHRMTRALRLTDAGEAAKPFVSQGLDRLSEALDTIIEYADDGLLTISVSPSFGSMWLVPRLDHFRQLHPEFEIRLDGTDRTVDVAKGDADVAVRYGPGGYKGVNSDLLLSLHNTPVCSPELLSGKDPLRDPDDLEHHILLHIDWKNTEASWQMWLLAAGCSHIDGIRGPRFSQESMAVQAALDGHGVALVGDRLVADHLASGRLVAPFHADLKTPLTFAYHLLTAKDALHQPKIAAFRSWLLEIAQQEADERRRDDQP